MVTSVLRASWITGHERTTERHMATLRQPSGTMRPAGAAGTPGRHPRGCLSLGADRRVGPRNVTLNSRCAHITARVLIVWQGTGGDRCGSGWYSPLVRHRHAVDLPARYRWLLEMMANNKKQTQRMPAAARPATTLSELGKTSSEFRVYLSQDKNRQAGWGKRPHCI
eukprot:scaffold22554_cov63-Phaeocystis_antarctica.AAC.6